VRTHGRSAGFRLHLRQAVSARMHAAWLQLAGMRAGRLGNGASGSTPTERIARVASAKFSENSGAPDFASGTQSRREALPASVTTGGSAARP
jgi:hypothetical protein